MKRLTLVVISLTWVICVALQPPNLDRVAAAPMSLTFTVINTFDDGAGSLRQAVAEANSNLGTDAIIFDASVFATPQIITLTSGEVMITDSVMINGPGMNRLTISGNTNARVFHIGSGSGDVTLSGLTIANGRDTAAGGGIFNAGSGTLTLSSVTVSGNSVTGAGAPGGGIFNSNPGTLTLIDSTVAGNSANAVGSTNGQGGGIFNAGLLTLINSTVSDNTSNAGPYSFGQGGGIFNFNLGTVTLINSTVSRNSAKGITFSIFSFGFGEGGGIFNAGGGAVNLTNSTVSTNRATGFGFPGSGGGIFNAGSGAVTIDNSTLSFNTANGSQGLGGGLFNAGSGAVTLTNSTFSGNSGAGGGIGIGGGIYNASAGSITLTNNTLSTNSVSGTIRAEGGGIFNLGAGPVNARNNIIAGNSSTISAPDVRGSFISQGHNLIGDGTGSSGFTGSGDQVGMAGSQINALLTPLGNYGGPTQTHALLVGSPAINTGDNCVTQNPGCLATPLATDQRGAGFARNRGGTVDIGAFEEHCAYQISPPLRHHSAQDGTGTVEITADAGCGWNTATSDSWIQVTAGSSGSGNGTLTYQIAANTGVARQGTITIAGQTFTIRQGANFADVTTDSFFYEFIGKLSAAGITTGCGIDGQGNPLYCPGVSVTREQMAAFLMRALGEPNPPLPGTQRFTDVPPNSFFYSFIARLATLGITTGCNPPTLDQFCPGSAVTREQMSAFIMRALGEFNPPTPASQRFIDVPPNNFFYPFIDRLAIRGITTGCNPPQLTQYCPGSFVTREQMAAFLARAFGL